MVADEPVADRSGTCRAPYEVRLPCPAKVTQIVGFDTTRLANGAHVLEVAAEDAAGNRTTSSRVDATVVNGGVANGANPSRRALLTTGFRRRGGLRAQETTDGGARDRC